MFSKGLLVAVFVISLFVPSLLMGQAQELMVGAPGVFPRWASGGPDGYRVVIKLVNIGLKPVQATSHFYLSTGKSPDFLRVGIVADDQGERFQDITNGILETTINKSIEIRTLGGFQELGGWIEFKAISEKVTGMLSVYYRHGSEELSTTVMPEPSRRSHLFFVDYKGDGAGYRQSTGIAIVNPDLTNSTKVIFTANEMAGRSVGEKPKELVLGPGESVAKFVHEIFPEIISRQEFHGTVHVASDRLTAAMGIRYLIEPNGQFHMDNFPSMPGAIAGAIRSICFFPTDVPVDLNCRRGLGKVARATELYWDQQMAWNNQRNFSDKIPFLYDYSSGEIIAEVVMGKYSSGYYSTLKNAGIYEINAVVRERYPDGYLFISHHSGGAALAMRDTAFFFSPNTYSLIGFGWADLLEPEQFLKTADRRSTRYQLWVAHVAVAAHEFGHAMAGLGHSLTLEELHVDKENVMRGACAFVIGGCPTPGMIVQTSPDTNPGAVDQIFPNRGIKLNKTVHVDSRETRMIILGCGYFRPCIEQ